ncbi:hypothetical protein Tco_0962757 [Tanacetum coccineum]
MELVQGTNPTRFDTSARNPIKEILLKLNLPDHRILKEGHGGAFGYGVLDGNHAFYNVDQIIFYCVSVDVDTGYSSKSRNGLDLV